MLNLRGPIRFARGNQRRLLLTIIALATGVALICALDLVTRGVLRAFVEVVDNMAGRASLQVSVGEGGFFAEDIVGDIAAAAGVAHAVPVVVGSAFTVERVSQSFTVHAFELTDAAAVQVYQPDAQGGVGISDVLEFLNRPDSIVVTRSTAQRYGLKLESPITLDTPSGRRVFVVRGLLDPHGIARAYGGNLMLMDIGAAQGVFAEPGLVNRIDVVVDDGAQADAVAGVLRARLPQGLKVETPEQRKADLHGVMRSLRLLLLALGMIALAAGFMIAFNRVSTIFEDRAWQLGVMRALGVRQVAVWRELIKEGVLIGLAGSVLGVPLGIILGRAILPVVAETTALNYRVVAPPAELDLAWPSLVLALALGIGAATLAAALPAWRASATSIVITMRERGLEQGERGSSVRRHWLAGLVAALVVASVAMAFVRSEAIWGFVATGLLVIGCKMAARPLLDGVMHPLSAWLQRHGGPILRLVLLGIMRKPRRTALTVAMVGIGLGAVIWLGFVAHSFEATTVRVFQHAMRADLVVSTTHLGTAELESLVDDRFADEIAAVDGVQEVVGVRLANWEFRGGPIVLDAFDPEYFTTPELGQWPLLGAHAPDVWQQVAAGTGVVVSSNLVRNVGVGVGEAIELETPNGPLQLRVVGVTTDFASPRGTIEMSRAVFARYWNDRRVTRFFVDAAARTDRDVVRAAIIERLGAGDIGWRVISSGDLVEHFAAQVRRAFASVYVLGAVILAVILFGIADNLSASVGERTRELGMLRALGLRRSVMWKLVVVEALLLAMLGLVLALIMGALVGLVWVKSTIPNVLGWVIDLEVPIALTLGVIGLTTLLCALAALLPGRRAAALEPAQAIRWE